MFDVALTEDQMQQMVFQEIEQNTDTPGQPLTGVVKGKVVPRDITDFFTENTIPWSNLTGLLSNEYYNRRSNF